MKNIINSIITLTLMTVVLVGCHHDDFAGWERNQIDGINFYSYVIDEKSNTPIYLTLPGYGGGYNIELGNIIVRHLAKRSLDGIVIVPHVEYKDGMTDEYLEVARKAMTLYENKGSSPKVKYILGVSAGANTSIDLSSKWNDISAIVPIVAGAYKDGGGTPESDMPFPGMDTYVFLLNGYDEGVLKKYGIHFDDVVFVDPTIRLYEELMMSSGKVEMKLVPGVSHGQWERLIDDSILDRLRMMK